MRLTIKINLNNAAFIDSDFQEIKTIFERDHNMQHIVNEAYLLYRNNSKIVEYRHKLRDSNGNTVGYWEITEEAGAIS